MSNVRIGLAGISNHDMRLVVNHMQARHRSSSGVVTEEVSRIYNQLSEIKAVNEYTDFRTRR